MISLVLDAQAYRSDKMLVAILIVGNPKQFSLREMPQLANKVYKILEPFLLTGRKYEI